MKNNLIGIVGGINSGKDFVAEIIQEQTDINWEVRKFADKLKDIVCLLLGCTREELEDREFKEKPLGEEWRRWTAYYGQEIWGIYTSKEEAKKEHKSDLLEYGFSIIEEILTPRKILQLLGTEGGRKVIHPNIWVNAVFADYKPRYVEGHTLVDPKLFEGDDYEENWDKKYPNWLITDTRFPNEQNMIVKKGGFTINLMRPFADRFPEYAHLIHPDNKYDFEKDKLKEEDFELFKKLTHDSETSLNDIDQTYDLYNDGTIQHLKDGIYEILEKEGLIS